MTRILDDCQRTWIKIFCFLFYSFSDDGLDTEGGTRSETPNARDDSTPTPEDKAPLPVNRLVQIDTSEYVPMLPRLQDIALHELHQKIQRENMYIVMR